MANGLLENFLAKEKERALAQSSVGLQDYLRQVNPSISSAVDQGLTPMQSLSHIAPPQGFRLAPELSPIGGVEQVDAEALYKAALQSVTLPQAPAQTRPTIPAQPQAPAANLGATLPGGAPRIGGLITRDATGQTTAFQQGGGALGTVGTGAVPQASLSDFAARQQARDLDPLRRDNAAIAGPSPLSSIEQANVLAGRPSNVSAGQVEAAKRSGLAAEAYANAAPQRQALEEAQSAIDTARFFRKEVTPDMLLNLQAAQQGLQAAQQKGTSEGLSPYQAITVAQKERDFQLKQQEKAQAGQESFTKASRAVRDMVRQNANVMDKATRAGKALGFTTSGLTGAVLSMIPGTGAYDQKSTVETLQADAAFRTLQQMRDASPSGGALGQVSERELDLLQSAVGNLKLGQSKEQFRENLAQYISMRNDAMLNVYDAFATDYGPQAANEAFGVSSRDDLATGEQTQAQKGAVAETSSGRYSVEVL